MKRAGDPSYSALIRCRRCPRLVAHRERIAQEKRRAYRDHTYWGRPVPAFGDPAARIVLLGLAPGAHGSNRTGRMFTGDASGDFLYPALHRLGFANQPVATDRGDGMVLRDLQITAALRCVPPQNKPIRTELVNCRAWLARDLARPGIRVVVALGRIAHEAYLDLLRDHRIALIKARHGFTHGALHELRGWPPLLDCYHVSFQNTNTGRLTADMLDHVLRQARALADRPLPLEEDAK